jgi:conjugative transfer signal peptidase TraF
VTERATSSRRTFLSSVLLSLGITAAVMVAGNMGYRLNLSESMPVGIWHIQPLPADLTRGLVVVLCMPPSSDSRMARLRRYIGDGPCPDETEPLLKPVAAVAGDEVTLSEIGVSINGKHIFNSAPLALDAAARPLPHLFGTYQVKPHEVWLISTYSPDSYDSRYFLGVPVSAIRGTARPVWVW